MTKTEAEATYEANTVEELTAELERRGLAKTGNKADLIERLEADDKAKADATPPEPAVPDEAELAPTKTGRVRAAALASGECVVNDGTGHTGRAVNGLVCSRHANRYHADGTPR
jgi:hypothetical protein